MKWNAINDRLVSVKESGKQDINYSYLSDGKRYTKTIAGKTKTYYYNNGIMLSERTDTERINFYYDSDGSVVELGVQTRVSKDRDWGSENRYFLVRYGQSDVVAIYRNDTSALVGTYEYDPWGKVLSVKYAENVNAGNNNDILNLNPFRYRGYYYDTETEFYYLNARYYDPQVKRFISADSVIAGISDAVTGYNLFAYCDNDPVNKTDATGNTAVACDIYASYSGGALVVIETVAAAVAEGIACTPVIGVVIAVVIGAGIVYTADKCGLFDLLEVTEKSEESDNEELDDNKTPDNNERGKETSHDSRVKPEAAVKGSKKHGVNWKEGPSRAKSTGKPQGQWAEEDLDYATEMANTLKPGEGKYFNMPQGSKSIVHMPNGLIELATRMWIRNNGTGTWHGYPMP